MPCYITASLTRPTCQRNEPLTSSLALWSVRPFFRLSISASRSPTTIPLSSPEQAVYILRKNVPQQTISGDAHLSCSKNIFLRHMNAKSSMSDPRYSDRGMFLLVWWTAANSRGFFNAPVYC